MARTVTPEVDRCNSAGADSPAMKLPRPLIGLVLGHFSIDFWQGALPALLPLLHTERHYTLAANGTVLLAFNLASSVVQPLFGFASDARPRPWLMPAGILLAGLAIALFGVIDHATAILVLATLGGAGVAAFHPEAVRLVRDVASADARTTALSWFNIGGALGFATGPLAAGALCAWLGLRGTLWLLVPLAGMVAYSWRVMHATTSHAAAKPAGRKYAGPDRWGGFALTSVAVICRSVVYFGLSTMVPLIWLRGSGHSAGGASMLVAALFGASVLGQFAGGRLGDRWGNHQTIALGFALQIPAMFLLARAESPLAIISLTALAGGLMSVPGSSMLALGHYFLPGRVGLASGVTVGLAITAGGMLAPWLGALADRHGAAAVIGGLAWVPFAAVGAMLAVARLKRTAAGPTP